MSDCLFVATRSLLDQGRVILQAPIPEPTPVEIPVFPVLVAVAGLAGIVVLSLGALRMPTLRRREPREPAPPRRSRRIEPVAAPPEPVAAPVAPVYKRAPVSILFPMIKGNYPDTWGVGEKAVIVFRAEDRGLVGKSDIKGLAARVADTPVSLVFYRGEARIERTFSHKVDVPITVELKVKGEKVPRRTTRVLRVVEYREEIAELFEQFKQDMSAKVTPLRADATAWEIYDALLDANPRLSQVALREVVTSFEEAKFSNHPVGRGTFEKMVHATRVLQPSEA